jgi:N-acyl-D-amino-acid deacylase
MNWLDKGLIREGADADLVIFDGDKLRDTATFTDELLPPEGIKWVIIGGEPAVKDSEVLGGPKGELMRRN